jgi:protein-disulfide isomerase
MLRKLLLSLTTFLALTSVIFAQDQANSFNPQQQKDIGNVVHQYLLDHPDVLVEVSQKLRNQSLESNQKQASEKISENINQLLSSDSPKLGNTQGKIYLVEFFDYRCGHCKHMSSIVNEVLAAQPNLQIVYKNFAVLGSESQLAARASLAAAKQGKFKELHEVLIKSNDLSKENIIKLAKDASLDVTKLEADMNSETVNKEINANKLLAEKIGIRGTPAFIVINKAASGNAKTFFLPGAVSKETLVEYIKKATS